MEQAVSYRVATEDAQSEATGNTREEEEQEAKAEGKHKIEADEASRIWTVINKWNQGKTTWEDVEDKFETPMDAQNKVATYRPILIHKVDYEDLEIHSEDLKDLLIDTDNWWDDFKDKEDKGQQMQAATPFVAFVTAWDRYQKACEPNEDDSEARKKSRKELNHLLRLISRSVGLESYFRSRYMVMGNIYIVVLLCSFTLPWSSILSSKKEVASQREVGK
ncbi:hypothetical protein DPSP01_014288 [Paraphaeosphaeria sporulosa]